MMNLMAMSAELGLLGLGVYTTKILATKLSLMNSGHMTCDFSLMSLPLVLPE